MPPRIGAPTIPIICDDPIIVVHRGRLRLGKQYDRITIEPDMMPAAPTPATARPRMNMPDVAATVQSREPTSNMQMLAMYSPFADTKL
ncbi:hypothetical protein DL770_003930 [Monosporascus sp. CRB-9-2]|nr:hypothetical protein DL770_003930 [Monosporascus sp. CRB-9-2]